MIDQDYDEDGNNIVPCPICLNVYCPSKEDGTCPDEEAFVKWHVQKDMDVVYILGSGSKWGDNELRYSLRSIEQHLPHRNVFIVGERPEWLANIIHIPASDGYANINGGKFKNVLRKTEKACIDDRVSDQFVLMNDDFFFLEYCNAIEPATNGTLRDLIEYYDGDDRNQYLNLLKRTEKALLERGIENAHNYALHYPIVYDKQKFLDMTHDIDWLEASYSWRTLYGNLHKIGSVPREDTKCNSPETFKEFAAADHPIDFLSISNNVALDPLFQSWIAARFPNKSKYEN
jgi:hypothetical protein